MNTALDPSRQAAVSAALAAGEPACATALRPLWWPLDRLGEGLEAVARAGGLAPQAIEALVPPPDLHTDLERATRWLDWAAARLGLEVEPVDAAVPEVPDLLRRLAPALLPWHDAAGGMGFLLLLGGRGAHVRLLDAGLRVRRLPLETLRQGLCRRHEAPLLGEVQALLQRARVPARRQPRARAALLRDRLADTRITPCWMVRLPAGAPLRMQARQARLPWLLAGMGLSYALLYALEIGAWGLMGEGVLGGRLDLGWLLAWVLLLGTMLPLQLWGSQLGASFSLRASGLLKARLLAGALRLDVDRVRHDGVGTLLGRVIESQALESLAVGGGLGSLVSLLELAFAAGVLALGAAPGPHLALLAGWLLLSAALCSRFAARLRRWTLARLALTHELIEQMVGHRTRLAQERAGRRIARDDAALHGYHQDAAAMDAAALPLQTLLPSGWMLAALALLVPGFMAGGSAAATLAISLGGILMAQRALGGLVGGLSSLARAGVAWQQVSALFHAGRLDAARVPPVFVQAAGATRAAGPLVDAQDLRFAHAGGAPVLRGVDLQLQPGDRVLLQGPSGGGKSTLAALLTGLRRPQSGLLLLQGLDAHTLGDHWGRLASAAPQFHENHVLSGSVAFKPADGPRLAAYRGNAAGGAGAVRGAGPGRAAAAHARRPAAAHRRDRLAALPRRTQPALPRPRAAAAGTADGARRELRRARPGNAGALPGLRTAAGAGAGRDRASLRRRFRHRSTGAGARHGGGPGPLHLTVDAVREHGRRAGTRAADPAHPSRQAESRVRGRVRTARPAHILIAGCRAPGTAPPWRLQGHRAASRPATQRPPIPGDTRDRPASTSQAR